MEIYSPADLVGCRRIHLDDQFEDDRRRGAVRPRFAAAADEPRRSRRRDRRQWKRAARFRSRSNGRRRETASCCERNAVEGMRAQPGDVLFRVADTSVVWAMVDVAERDLGARGRRAAGRDARRGVFRDANSRRRSASSIRRSTGRPARRASGSNWRTRISPCFPTCMSTPKSTPAVRQPVLAVPDSAVLDNGSRQVVLVDKGRGPLRAARREARPSRRWLCRSQGRHRRRRAGRDFGELPDRRRKQPEGGAEGICRKPEASHDRASDRLVGPQPAAGAVRRRRSPPRPASMR